MHRLMSVLIIVAALHACGRSGPSSKTLLPDSVIRGVNFVGVHVSDLDAAERLYADVVDAKRLESADLPPGNVFSQLVDSGDGAVRTRLIRRTNSQLRLMTFAERSMRGQEFEAVVVQGPGISHMCFQLAEETNAYAQFLEAGATPIGDPDLIQLNPENPVRYGYVTDPDGIITEVEEIDLEKLERGTPVRNMIRVRHVSLATPDLARLIKFYSAFLGGQEPRHVGRWFAVEGEKIDKVSGLAESKIEMAWFQLRNLEIEIFQYHSHPTSIPVQPRPIDAPGYNMIVFDVSDLEQARQRVLTAGGDIVTDVGTLDGGGILFARDPDGNLIGLQTLPPDSVYSAANFPDNGL
ncbi:MAG: VOC family protein [Pseudomonadota bacterium]